MWSRGNFTLIGVTAGLGLDRNVKYWAGLKLPIQMTFYYPKTLTNPPKNSVLAYPSHHMDPNHYLGIIRDGEWYVIIDP